MGSMGKFNMFDFHVGTKLSGGLEMQQILILDEVLPSVYYKFCFNSYFVKIWIFGLPFPVVSEGLIRYFLKFS